MLVFEKRGKSEYPEKKHRGARTRTDNKRNSHITPGIEFGPHWWEASVLTTAPCLFPKFLFDPESEGHSSVSCNRLLHITLVKK